MATTSAPVRWGILGTGAIAQEFAYGLSILPEAKLLAVGSRRPDSGQRFAQAHQIPKVYDTYEALVADGEIDVVYIATPHFRHHQDCLLCLNGGKAVLCEKPLALNGQQGREVAAAAHRHGVFCMEAMWMRFMPLIQRVQALIQQGAIGQVLSLSADFGYPTDFDPGNRFFNLQLGGGALLDRGSYPLSLAFQLLGAPSSVTGQACIGETGVDDQSALILTYSSGQLAQLGATLRGYATNTATITGTRGKIIIHPPFCRPDKITLTPLSEQPVVTSSQASTPPSKLKRQVKGLVKRLPLTGAVASLRNKTQAITAPITGNGFNYEAMEVIRCLRQNRLESPLMPLDESVKILEVMDQLRRSWGLHYPQDSI